MIAKARRSEDLTVRLLVADVPDAGLPSDAAAVRFVEYAFDPATGQAPTRARAAPAATGEQATCIVIPTANGDALFIAGAQVERLHGDRGPLLDRAAAEALAWRRRSLRAARHQVADERVILLGEQLNRESSAAGIYRAVMEHAAPVLGGYAVLILERRVDSRAAETVLRAVPNPRIQARLDNLPVLPFLPFGSPGLVDADQARDGQPFECLQPLFNIDRAAAIAYVPIGDYGFAALIERRHDRVFEPDDWFRFGAIARHAVVALDRVGLRQQARSLAMTDPLSGLGTMARLAVLAPYHVAAARRGTPLSLAVFDMPAYGLANADTDGAIHRFAETLRLEARASDVLIRAGAASFVALLPGSARSGARAFTARVRNRFADVTRIDIGIAEFDPEMPTFADLLASARASIGPSSST